MKTGAGMKRARRAWEIVRSSRRRVAWAACGYLLASSGCSPVRAFGDDGTGGKLSDSGPTGSSLRLPDGGVDPADGNKPIDANAGGTQGGSNGGATGSSRGGASTGGDNSEAGTSTGGTSGDGGGQGGDGGENVSGSSCANGSYDHDSNLATACLPWSKCGPGQYVSSPGTANADRECRACGAAAFSSAENLAACDEWTRCEPGESVRVAGTSTADAQCRACPAGTFSDQADAAVCDACPDGTFSEDSNATACEDWTECQPGESVTDEATADSDRTCDPCAPGTYSAAANADVCTACASGTFSSGDGATACNPWTVCSWSQIESDAGTASADARCAAGGDFRQFGTTGSDQALGVAIDTNGAVYVVGATAGAFEGTNAGYSDAFVRKYTSNGNEVWTHQFGAVGDDSANAAAVDSSGNVLVGGAVLGLLQTMALGDYDGFLRKYDETGSVVWTRQFGTNREDRVNGVATDGSGNTYVSGYTYGDLAITNLGSSDVFLRKYDSAGAATWTRQYGTTGIDYGYGVATDPDGDVYVVGVSGAAPGSQVSGDGELRKYDSNGDLKWSNQFGGGATVYCRGVALDALGNVYVSGFTYGAVTGSNLGGADAFLRKYSAAGTPLWTKQFGTTSGDYGWAAAVDASGNPFVAGYTLGVLQGGYTGYEDGFVRQYDPSGNVLWTRQFGTTTSDHALGATASGSAVFVVGDLAAGDAFVARLVPP